MQKPSNGLISVVGRFLFAPADPTTLGFMRIMTGLLVLYSTFAYSFDLKWLMGPDAFSNQAFENQARRERSYVSFPISWNYLEPSVRIEDSPHRRGAIMEFMRGLPESVEERKQKLAFLARVTELSYEDQQASYFLPNSAARLSTETEFEQVAKALQVVDPKMADSPVTFPPFVWRMPVAERLEFWKQIRTFTDLLPVDPSQQEYVLSWLSYYQFENRKDLVRYLAGDYVDNTGKQLGLPADKEIRAEYLRYLELWGLDPRQHELRTTPIFSAFFHLKNLTSMWFFHMLVMGIAILYTVGLWTRVTSILLFLTSLSYIHRASAHMFGQDTMQTILQFYLMIAPCGAALSIDALRGRYRATRAIQEANGKPVPWAENILAGPQPSWLANFTLRLFQMHYGLIYLVGGASKLKGSAWWNHNAGWMTMINPDFGLVYYPWYEGLMHWIADQRLLVLLVSGFGVIFTIGLEIGFIFLIWTRARPIMLMWAFTFHTMIGLFMGLCVFAMNMFTLMLCYFPAKLIRERVAVTPGGGEKLLVRHDPTSARQNRTVAVIRTLDLAGQVRFVGDPSLKTLRLTDSRDTQYAGNGVLGEAVSRLALTRPAGVLLKAFLGGGGSATDEPESNTMASVFFFGGIALSVISVFGVALAYADNDGVRPALPVLAACAFGFVAGGMLKLIGLRSYLFKGAL